MATTPRFARFAAIDWSGARGEAQRGIAIAVCDAGCGAPRLIDPPARHWTRATAQDWIVAACAETPTLVGLDLGMAFAFVDRGGYFPGWLDSPADGRTLWTLVERLCAADPHLSAGSFVDHVDASRHFRRHGGRLGDRFEAGAGRLRVTEAESRNQRLASPVSNFNLVGAAQVGKASLTGMRMLHRLDGRIRIWPFDAHPASGSALVEIYTSIAARAAGLPKGRAKIRDRATLTAALVALGSAVPDEIARDDDHATDALMTAAWLRPASADARLWSPKAMTRAIARTEGWTFGVA